MNPPGEWDVSGSYYETCSCDAVCPCRRHNGRPGGRSVYGVCQFLLTWHVLAGHAGSVDLSGRRVAMAGFYNDDEQEALAGYSLCGSGSEQSRPCRAEAIFLAMPRGEPAVHLAYRGSHCGPIRCD
jgi:hypothetical protein